MKSVNLSERILTHTKIEKGKITFPRKERKEKEKKTKDKMEATKKHSRDS